MAESRDDRRNTLLEPAFTAAHRALVRLEDDEVPAALRLVRATSKKKALPKPLRAVLATHLEEEWLRTLAAAELREGESAADRASWLFLTRPEGWEASLDAIVEDTAERSVRHELDSVLADLDRLRRLNDDLGGRLAEAEARGRESEAGAGSDDRLERLKRRLDEEIRMRQHRERVIGERDDEITRLRRELIEADERIGLLRSRNVPGDRPGEKATGGGRTFGRGNPVETAKFLDELVEAMRPRRHQAEERPSRAPLALPTGIRPDSAEAIDWIRTIDRKVLVLVDGHNVAHDFASEPGRTVRDRIVSETARLRRLSDGPVSAVVFFDTGHAAESHQNFGVSVRYVADADDAIETAAANSEAECIVISTDKEVRRRASAHGALSLWGTAFSDWIKRK